eukprot:5525753-Prymnesium_polylepis.1
MVSVPHEVALETPFEVECVVSNTSSKEQQLSLHFESMPGRTGGLVFDGVSGRELGRLKPHGNLQFRWGEVLSACVDRFQLCAIDNCSPQFLAHCARHGDHKVDRPPPC